MSFISSFGNPLTGEQPGHDQRDRIASMESQLTALRVSADRDARFVAAMRELAAASRADRLRDIDMANVEFLHQRIYGRPCEPEPATDSSVTWEEWKRKREGGTSK